MKSSPLQLKWVNYPSASYETVEDFDGGDVITPTKVHAEVGYSLDGDHVALIRISSDNDAKVVPYRFSVAAIAVFNFDLAIALAEYKVPAKSLPPVIAVNVARILFAGAREHIAMMTARATFGSTVLESVLLEPKDVKIGSEATPEEILRKVFQVDEEELIALKEKITSSQRPSTEVSKNT